MKRLISRILILIVLFVIANGAIYLFTDKLLKVKKHNFLKLNKDINAVFAGDSNMENGVNDSLIPNSINIAQSGEAYLYTYEKLKSLLEVNPRVKSIYLAFARHDLSKAAQDDWMFDEASMIDENKVYNYLLDSHDKCLLFSHNPKAYLIGLRDCTGSNITNLIKNWKLVSFDIKKVKFGGYRSLDSNKLQEAIKKQAEDTNHFHMAYFQLKYLEKISDLCQEKSVKLILLNTPKNRLSNDNYDVREIMNEYKSIFSKDSLLDCSKMLLPDSCFADLMHLNYKGSKLFSIFLSRSMHNNLQ
jgi:hypothetical protein